MYCDRILAIVQVPQNEAHLADDKLRTFVVAVELGDPRCRVGDDAPCERVEVVEQGRQGPVEDRDARDEVPGSQLRKLGLGVEAHYGGLYVVRVKLEVGDGGHMRLDGGV